MLQLDDDGRSMNRRQFWCALGTGALSLAARAAPWPDITPGAVLRFPRDHGAHPEFRTEWWYLTGWLRDDSGRDLGVQITFFRSRPRLQDESASRFAPDQLLFAHAAIADPRRARLQTDQRAARAGFDLAEASTITTDVRIDDWRLALSGDRYRAVVRGREFDLDIEGAATQPILLQGDAGFSRKGPKPFQASRYYSRPHLGVTGTLMHDGQRTSVVGTAWLDHEWSSDLLDTAATGWDWCGINLLDGGALMAFRIRDGNGNAIWAGGCRRQSSGKTITVPPSGIAFSPQRHWTSPRTGTRYPVRMGVMVAGEVLSLEPLFDDQELDARASTGTVYWEGAVRALAEQREVGRGYLELTGYHERVRL